MYVLTVLVCLNEKKLKKKSECLGKFLNSSREFVLHEAVRDNARLWKNATTLYSISTSASSVWNQVWLPEYEWKTANRQPNKKRKYIRTYMQ